jgi:hypothetical protein
MTLSKGKRVESGEEMKLKLPSRKQIIWLLVLILFITWGVQRRNKGIEDAKMQAKVETQLSKEMEIQGKIDLDKFSHGMYQSYICGFSKNLQPVSEMLLNISKKTAIPPDFLSVMKDFNDAAKFLSSQGGIFLGKDAKLTEEELKIDFATKAFAKELNLKTAELEQGIINYSNPYFANLEKSITTFVAPACALYNSANPSPSPTETKSPLPRSFDSKIDKISKQVSYEGICSLEASSESLLSDIENAQTSKAFKPALLESSKTTIYDLGYAAFSFSGRGLYTPSPSEKVLSSDFEALKSKLEQNRYVYWGSTSAAALVSMKTLANQIRSMGSDGCAEVNRLKKQ